MTPIGPRHNASVDRATRTLVTAVGDHAIVRVQGSVRLDRYRQPQPDFVLLRPQPDFYEEALPGPSDILLIIEIAESSLEYDRTLKARIYAESGVREYWLVDLNGRSVSCYSEPRDGAYQRLQRYGAGQSIAPESLPECAIKTDVLLLTD
jgi:Uma2 family endonuclease